MANDELAWLDEKHPIWTVWAPIWARQERLLRGGVYVKGELRRFDWETLRGNVSGVVGGADEEAATAALATGNPRVPFSKPGEHYEMRQRQATYMNFPDLFASVTVGHLMRQAPMPDFGTLGAIDRADGVTEPSNAELVYYNVDGVGNDGSQWKNYWTTSGKRAMATGHRWHFAEAPAVKPTTRRDVLLGRRPYLIEFSPTRVTNWEYDQGQLLYAVIRVPATRTKLVEGKLVRVTEPDYLLVVRQGFTGLDAGKLKFSIGGWWLFDGEKEPLRNGRWDKTKGECPLWPLFYERDMGVDGADEVEAQYEGLPLDALPAMSRPAMMDVGNAAAAYMNLTSAVNFELWDGAKGIEWLLGVDGEAWQLAMEKLNEGSRWVPLQVHRDTEAAPSVQPKTGDGEIISAFKVRLDQIRQEVRELMSQEVSGTPDSSGISKAAGFAETKSPRLATFASEIEQAQNTAIYFLELRFGNVNPTGSVTWPEEFELIDFGERLAEFIDAQAKVGVKSPTATAKAMRRMAEAANLGENDEEYQTIEDEFFDAVGGANELARAQAQLLASVGVAEQKPTVPAPADKTAPTEKPAPATGA
jgi:hypothetical protein